MRTHRLVALFAALLAAGACRDLPTAPTAAPAEAPMPPASADRTPVRCSVTLASRAVSCATPVTPRGLRQNIIIGGQGLNVRLVSTNVNFDGGDNVFSFDVTVQNLIDQPLGTDGTTESGVRVFFNSGPTATEGSGEVTVLTDSVGVFLAANQPYYKYDGVIQPRGVSQPQRWEFSVDEGVDAFAFIVYVETQVPGEQSILHWRPEQGTQLFLTDVRALFAASPHDVFAASDGAVLHFDGNYWRAMDAGPCGCASSLHGLWGSSGNDVYAVGTTGTVLHWTGGEWTPVEDPDVGTANLYGVWGSSASDIWVVGDFGTVLHNDGADWTVATTDLESAVPLFSVWGSGPDDAWAVGEAGTALHWDGDTWTVQAFPDPDVTLTSVWGTAANDVWAAGFDDLCGCGGGVLYHFDGSDWTEVTGTPDLSEIPLYGGWSSGPNDVWVAGFGVVLHYDGSDWTQETVGYGLPLYAVTGTSSSNVFAAGALATVARNQGSGWQTVSIPDFEVRGIWGPSSSEVWAVGGGVIRHRTSGAWTMEVAPDGATLTAVWGAAASDVWAVGEVGAVAHYDGNAWSSVVVDGVTATLRGVWGSGASDVWAVGDDGVMLHWNGGAWTSSTVGSAIRFAVWGSSSSDVFAVGDGGDIQHWNGVAWTAMNSGTTSTLTGVWGSGPNDVYAVGFDGTVLHYDGNPSGDWTAAPTPADPATPVFAVWGSGANDVYFLANAGQDLMHWNGTSWRTLASFSRNAGILMYTLWGTGPYNIYAGGDLGTILHGVR